MLLGYTVVFEMKRPAFPDIVPEAYRLLAERCWHPSFSQRPSMQEVRGLGRSS